MSDQALDLRRSARIIRRHKLLVGSVAAAGLLAGGAYSMLKPPMLTSTAQVLLPPTPISEQATTSTGAPDPYTATQEVIASSSQVLSGALADVRPAMSLSQLRQDIQVGSLTPYVISVSAKGKTAANAEATANAVAVSYIHYLGSPESAAGQLSAHLLEPATSAVGPAPLKTFALNALAGAIFGAVIGAIAALAIGRKDRRARTRDEIANSIGVPVLASVAVGRPADASSWTKLLDDYQPGEVDAWRLRKALYQLGLAGPSSAEYPAGGGSSLAIISLSADHHAIALGPQLAVFAASLGINTALVVGPQQDTNAVATLRAACATPASPKRGNLSVLVSDHPGAAQFPGAALTVVVAVVDGKDPQVTETMRAAITLLGVTAGAATAEQLARVAASAAADGRDIAGIIVADADSADPTTGRLRQLPGPGQRGMPIGRTGSPAETRW
jgi:capsular polysaccharide biosynthesis protein